MCVETCLKVVVASGGLDFELESVHQCGNYPLTVARDDPQPYSKEGHGCVCASVFMCLFQSPNSMPTQC